MGCHAGTGGDPSGDNRVLGSRDPITGTEQIGHIIAIVQDSQARLGISTEITASVSQSTTAPMSSTACVSARGTSQKIGRKPTSLRSLLGDEFTEIPICSIECDQLRVPHTNHCLICDL